MTSPIVLPEISSLLDSECQGIGLGSCVYLCLIAIECVCKITGCD
jgi:hypothetical protein